MLTTTNVMKIKNNCTFIKGKKYTLVLIMNISNKVKNNFLNKNYCAHVFIQNILFSVALKFLNNTYD